MKNESAVSSGVIWPDVFTTGDITGRCDALLCADALSAWGCCHMGDLARPIPEKLGDVMVKIGQKLGCSPDEKGLLAWVKRWQEEQAKQTGVEAAPKPG